MWCSIKLGIKIDRPTKKASVDLDLFHPLAGPAFLISCKWHLFFFFPFLNLAIFSNNITEILSGHFVFSLIRITFSSVFPFILNHLLMSRASSGIPFHLKTNEMLGSFTRSFQKISCSVCPLMKIQLFSLRPLNSHSRLL